MNERILELADQCEGRTICDCGEVGFNFEKFAELIALECADIALKSGNIANKNIAAKIESERIYHKIKEYFGVDQ